MCGFDVPGYEVKDIKLKDIVMEDKAGRNKTFDGVITDVSDLTPDNISLEYCENIRFENVELIPRSL